MLEMKYILLLFFILLVFKTIHVWCTTNEITSCKPGQCENNGKCLNETCFCEEGWTGALCQFCDRRFRLTADEGELHDGAGNYSLNTKCGWIIDTNSTKPIKLTFEHFSTECGWDHLHVFDGPSVYSPLVGSFSGISKNVKDVTLHSGKGFLYFFSDIAYTMGGFNLTYRVLHCPSDCSGHGVCNSTSQTCTCDTGWMGDDCSTNLGCPSLCSSAGTCINGTCICNSNRTGADCSISMVSSISWRTVTDMDASFTTIGRASMGADVIGDNLYVYGGATLYNRYTIHSNISADFIRFNILTQKWDQLHSNISTVNRFGQTLSADTSEKKLYLYGGTVNGIPTAELSRYDLLSDSWQLLTDGLLAVTGHTAHVIHGMLYVFFGQSALYGFHHTLQVYNISNDSWSMLSTSGVHVRGRYGHSSVYDEHSNSVFVFGGYHGNKKPGSYIITNYAYRFLVDSSTWVGLTPAPYVAYLHSAVLLPEGYMLVSGGNSHNDTASSSGTQCYSSTLVAYDICCDRWTKVTYADTSLLGVDRYGHQMFLYNESAYIFGGFNGIMLKDTLELFTPDCTKFTSESECVAGGMLKSISSNHTLCQWSSSQGCSPKKWTGSCDVKSCQRTEEENKQKCDQFTDCISCLSTDDCFYKSSSSDFCGVIPPPANVNPALQDVSVCAERVCEIVKDCELCNSISQCVWTAELGGCIQRRAGIDISKLSDAQCGTPCYTLDSCTNCTSNSCLWCESQSLCVDSNSYLTYFPYGQCLEWTTAESKCEDVSCEQMTNCSMCHRNAMCGWCNDPSNTGKGRCMKGGLYEDLNSTCASTAWHFSSCPACQCNGHSSCDSRNRCIHCTHNTTGPNCETCAYGFFGNPANGGTCQQCDCEGVADYCDSMSGECFCQVQGAIGAKCDSCDNTRQYTKDTIYNEECHYKLNVDYRYTFNFSKTEDKYISRINLQCQPNYSDIDVEFTIECSGYANSNLTLYSTSYPGKYKHFRTISCPRYSNGLTLSHADYEFGVLQHNATFLLILEDFTTPFVFKVSFTQHSRINLMLFLLIFFGCFVALLLIAGLSWKIRVKYLAMVRRSQARQERRVMASRPFSSVLLSADDLKSLVCQEQQLVQQPAQPNTPSVGEPLATLQRTFSKRSRRKQGVTQQSSSAAVSMEPLEDKPAAVATVLIKLPTGGEELPGYGSSGLAFGSTLVVAGSSVNNAASTKVVYKQGKVMFKPSSIFRTS